MSQENTKNIKSQRKQQFRDFGFIIFSVKAEYAMCTPF